MMSVCSVFSPKRVLSGIALLLGALFSLNAFALGLGKLTLHSALNQPLVASIPLLDIDGVIVEDMRVRITSASPNDTIDLQSQQVVDLLSATLEQGGSMARVVLQSKEVMREPLFDINVVVTWPQGEFSRSYTLFLDPPTVAKILPLPEMVKKEATGVAASTSTPTPTPTEKTAAPKAPDAVVTELENSVKELKSEQFELENKYQALISENQAKEEKLKEAEAALEQLKQQATVPTIPVVPPVKTVTEPINPAMPTAPVAETVIDVTKESENSEFSWIGYMVLLLGVGAGLAWWRYRKRQPVSDAPIENVIPPDLLKGVVSETIVDDVSDKVFAQLQYLEVLAEEGKDAELSVALEAMENTLKDLSGDLQRQALEVCRAMRQKLMARQDSALTPDIADEGLNKPQPFSIPNTTVPNEIEIQLQLARAHLDKGEQEAAKPLLQTVLSLGDAEQRRQAAEWLLEME